MIHFGHEWHFNIKKQHSNNSTTTSTGLLSLTLMCTQSLSTSTILSFSASLFSVNKVVPCVSEEVDAWDHKYPYAWMGKWQFVSVAGLKFWLDGFQQRHLLLLEVCWKIQYVLSKPILVEYTMVSFARMLVVVVVFWFCVESSMVILYY